MLRPTATWAFGEVARLANSDRASAMAPAERCLYVEKLPQIPAEVPSFQAFFEKTGGIPRDCVRSRDVHEVSDPLNADRAARGRSCGRFGIAAGCRITWQDDVIQRMGQNLR